MLREILARFGIAVDTTQLTRANAGIAGAIGSLRTLGGLLAGAVIVRGFARFIGDMIQAGDETAKTSRALGISADALQAWTFAAERSGVESTALVNGLRRLQRNIVDASEGVDTAQRAFRDLGVSFEDNQGQVREVLDILPELADGFGTLATDTQRSARAQQLFGRSGAQLLPFFAEGSEGLEELLQRFRRLGGGFGARFLENAEEAQDALSDFDLAMRGLKSTIAVDILPAITRFATSTAELVADISDATEGTSFWRLVLVGLGAAATAAGIALIAAFIGPIVAVAKIGLVILGLILIIDDFITHIEGGESAVGNLIDELQGTGAAEASAIRLRSNYRLFGEELQNLNFDTRMFTANWEAAVDVLRPSEAQILRLTANYELFGEELQRVGRVVEILKEGLVALGRTVIPVLEDIGQVVGVLTDGLVALGRVLGRVLLPIARLPSTLAGFGPEGPPEAGAGAGAEPSGGQGILGALSTIARIPSIAAGMGREGEGAGSILSALGTLARLPSIAAGMPAVSPPAPAGPQIVQQQQVDLTIQAGPGTDVSAIERTTRRVMREENDRSLRGAQRALTQVTE